MSYFVNYFEDDSRSSPINLAVGRVLLGVYIAWRVISLDWAIYQEWPWALNNQPNFLYQDALLAVLPLLQWVLVGFLFLFVVGFGIRWTAGLSGLLLAFMLSVKSTLYLAGTVESLFVCSYLLLLFAFFHSDDVLSVDGVRRTKHQSLKDLNAFLKGRDEDDSYQHRPFKWGLIVVGLMYLGSAWGKIMRGPAEIWLSGTELQRDLLYFQEVTGLARPLAQPLIHVPELAWLGLVSTTIFQVGLLAAILLGLTITPFVLGLISFHVVVIATMGLYFIDMILVLILFGAWDRAYRVLITDREIDLVYDEHCYFCTRVLYPFKLLDVNNTIKWYSQYDAPESHNDRDDVNFEDEMYVFVDGEAFGGYFAFQQLLKQFGFTLPVAWLMATSPIAAPGQRLYQYTAENRDRHFVCSFEPDDRS